MKIIVTGFVPFGNVKINPSLEVLKLLEDNSPNTDIYKVELPVVYDKCFEVLQEYIKDIKPNYILCLGVASNRKDISLEEQAINLKKAKIADNDGNLFNSNDEIIIGAKKYLKTSINLETISELLSKKGINNHLSCDAGSYACNNLYYHVLNSELKFNYKGLFIHLPGLEFKNVSEDLLAIKTIINELKCN